MIDLPNELCESLFIGSGGGAKSSGGCMTRSRGDLFGLFLLEKNDGRGGTLLMGLWLIADF